MTRFRAALLAWALLTCGVGMLATAQVPMTGAGKGAPGASGPAVCAGTVLHLTSPDDLTNGAWAPTGFNVLANAATAPDSTMTASTLEADHSGVLSSEMKQSITLSSGVTYSVSFYYNSLVGNPWVLTGPTDSTANAFQNWFGLTGAGTVGNPNVAGDGSLTCTTISNQGSGWYFISMAGAYTTGRAAFFSIFVVDSDGGFNATVSQKIAAWHVGQ